MPGSLITIRPAAEEDAAAFLDLWDALDNETEFMLYEPEERRATLDTQSRRLRHAVDSDHVCILVAIDTFDDRIVGFTAGSRDTNFRDDHKLHVVIGLRQSHVGQGLGFRLLTSLEGWAKARQLHRMELTVSTSNKAAIHLYEKFGFSIEGRKLDSVKLKSGFVDEFVMAKLV